MLLLPLAGCLEEDNSANEVGTFTNVEWTAIPLESKSDTMKTVRAFHGN